MMRLRNTLKTLAGLTLTLCGLTTVRAAESPAAPADLEFFEKHVRPVLVDQCYSCHSSKAEKGIKGGLNLESKEGWLKGGENGAALVPGDPERSLLIKAIRYTDPDLKMPPKDKKLSAGQIADLEAWVRMGAPDPRSQAATGKLVARDPATHWAFQPVKEPAVPQVKNRSRVKTPVDAFLLARLEPKGLKLSPEAERRTLIRRAYFTLLGLPPTPQEVTAFEKDRSPDAFAKVVDRLLESPHYGERWGRYWLDVARYADTKGYVFEEERRYPYSYTYRDYVIRAFNEDLPYDRFIQEQLAADLLPLGEDQRALAALGYLTLGRRFLNNQADIIDDRIDVMTRGLMGLTVVCARCHDHKFDPIPTKDYYSLYGVFASSHEPAEKPLLGSASLPKEHPAYVEERKKRVQEKDSYRAERDAEAFLKVRSQAGDYLLALHDSSALPEGEGREKLVRERKLEPAVARKFRSSQEAWGKKAPAALQPWFALASLPASNFVATAKASIDSLGAGLPDGLRDVLTTNPPPSSLRDVADRYNLWFSAAAKILARPPEGGRPAGAAAAIEFFEAADSPLKLNADELHRVFDTPAQQKLRALQRKIDELDATHAGAPPRAMAIQENATPDSPYVFKRGNPGLRGDAVPRQFLEILSAGKRKPFEKGSGRLEMARAVASRDNPLTARVMVNRVWAYHFGAPLVRTPSDFGVRSDPPSHPELLDYLASRFMAEGWSIKKLHRTLMLSSAFQQASDDIASASAADPGNELYWRQNRRRLDFEAMRDTLLSVSGRLDLGMGGHPSDITTQPFTTRRTVYAFVERQNLPGLFRTFDFASPDTTSPQRFSTTVPQQALFLMNSPFIAEQARALLHRPQIEAAKGEREKIKALYEVAFQRSPDATDLELGRAFVRAPADPVNAAPEAPVWLYGYGGVDEAKGRVTGFQPLPHFNNYAYQGGKELPDPKLGWVLVSAEGGHPGGSPGLASIRRWVAPRDGRVTAKAELSHPDAKGDGVRARLISSRLGSQGEWIAHNSKTNTEVAHIEVRKGDALDFVVDCRGNEGYDSFTWSPRIRYVQANGKKDTGEEGKIRWVAKDDFKGPEPAAPPAPNPWERYAQALLLSNELFFID